jgi:hypothetical protein
MEKAMIEMTIKSTQPLPTAALGRVPGGYRIQVTYGPEVTFSGKTSEGEQFEGAVVTGTDWILLRDDGVAVFDGKITFRATKPGVHVFDADIDGRVNLKPIGGGGAPIRDAQGWKSLGASRKALKVALPIAFETTSVVPPDASRRIAEAAENGKLFVELAKHQFVARGTIEVERGQIMSLDLRVEELLGQRLWPDSVVGQGFINRYAKTNPEFGSILKMLAEALPLDDNSWKTLRDTLKDKSEAFKALSDERRKPIEEALTPLAKQESARSASALIYKIFGGLDERTAERAAFSGSN